MNGVVPESGGVAVVAWTRYWEVFWALSPGVRAAATAGVTVALAVALVGLFPEYGQRGAQKARRHSVASTFIGALVVGCFLGSVAALLYGAARDETVSMLAAPVLFVLAAVAVVWVGIGLVALGGFVAARVGHDDAAWGTVVAAALAAVGAVYPPFGAVVFVLAALLGFGAGVRTNPFARPERERVVPPDNKA
jgi:hypothetical protein